MTRRRREWKERHVRIGTSRPSGTAPWHNAEEILAFTFDAHNKDRIIETEKRYTPREFLSPLGVNSRDVRTTLFPFGLPNLPAVERGTVEVRASERLELRIGKVQRRPELTGRRERFEIRCMDERIRVVAMIQSRYPRASHQVRASGRGKNNHISEFAIIQ